VEDGGRADVAQADPELVRAAARRKERSLAEAEAALESELIAEVARVLGDDATEAVRAAVRYLAVRLQRSASPERDAYLKHALRVALLTLRWDPRPHVETVALAVLHNVHEVTGSDEAGLLAAGFSERVAAGVRALTIDRARSEEDAYLRAFYAGVERAGHHVAVVRCADKIDNILGYDASSADAGRVRYVDLTERFVLPIAERTSAPLGRLLEAAIAEARRAA
jgi:(p)ppGpp synthase/HD superfamily hydrolase